MAQQNAYISQIVEREIARRIVSGQLYTKEMVNAAIVADHEMYSKMVTIAINRGLKVGKKRIEEKVQPELDALFDDYFRRMDDDNGDQTHAISVVERMFNQIMEE